MEDRTILLAHMEDLARRAAKTGAACSKFLTPAQVEIVRQAFSRRGDVAVHFDGGFEGAERQLAIFLEPQWGALDRASALCGLSLTCRRQDSLGHRDILGAVMALGVKREVIGDIETGQPCWLACTAEMAPYLAENLTQAGRVGFEARVHHPDALPPRTVNMARQQDTVASTRLDVLVAAAFNLSRSAAADSIRAGLVQLDHLECLDVARVVEEGGVLSLRGKGKVRLLEIGGQSRKGRLWITLGRYL